MPRAGESQLSLSVRQEGSGAMRMSLRAAYSLTHEPENSSFVVISSRKSITTYLQEEQFTSISSLSSNLYTLHCGSHIALEFGTSPFITHLCSLKKENIVVFLSIHATVRKCDLI